IFDVRENPLVGEISILGNDEIPDKKLKPKLKLKSGQIYSKARVAADIKIIQREYLKEGYYQVEVELSPKTLKDGRVDVTFDVHEGEVTRIKRIRFVGNQTFSDSKLRGVIASREANNLPAWFSDADIVDKKRMGADGQLLDQFYRNHGFLDVNIESMLFTLSPDKEWFYITFNLHEGIQYRVGKLVLQGDMVPSREVLMDSITLESGEIYSQGELQKSLEAMNEQVGDEGYAFASVTPLFQRHLEEKTVDLTFDIEKGSKVYIKRIEIGGNQKTEDRIIRREIRLAEGELFSASKLSLSKRRLNKLDYFEDIRVSLPKGSEPDKVIMKVDIEEKQTGSFSLGGGYSQLEKLFFSAKVDERNFLGKGWQANLSGEIGSKTKNYSLSVTEPYFLEKDLSVSVNAFKQQTRLEDFVLYKQDNIGGGINFGIPLTENLNYGVGYQIARTNIFDLPPDSSAILLSQAGVQTTGEVIQSLGWDTTDHPITPSSGHLELFHLGIAGLGGSNRFVETRLSSEIYFPISEGLTLSPSLKGKYIRGFSGRGVPIYRRYSLGGLQTMRGFDSFGISILDPVTGDILGGNKTVTASLDLFFPIPYMQTSGFRGVVFVDTGTVADHNQSLQIADLRVSYGFGIQWLSPVGPIGLVWGFPIRKQPEDRVQNFNFAIGSQF
ncbi:MAG: outer membrane protein assembly factor BamA, partial [Mariprofundaceae bacterium]